MATVHAMSARRVTRVVDGVWQDFAGNVLVRLWTETELSSVIAQRVLHKDIVQVAKMDIYLIAIYSHIWKDVHQVMLLSL